MNNIQTLFLNALRAALCDEQVDWEEALPEEDWKMLFSMAAQHHILPMIYEATYSCPAAQKGNPQLMEAYRQPVMRDVMMQTMMTAEFLALYRELAKKKIHPLVVKGIICRNLYPRPDYRMSGDEDMLIAPEQFVACDEAMRAYGMQYSDPMQDPVAAHEVPYGRPGSPIYIELHKYLFPPESEAYGDMNRFFEGVHERGEDHVIDGVAVRAMNATDHLFYLICHSFKHFLHSGFGIRQVCDITLFANAYGKEINWEQVLEQCRAIRADLFAAALFRIGEKYLTFRPDEACLPESWRQITVDETMMLEDLLDSGVYGDSTMSRKHSSNMTLDAVAAQKQGKKSGNGVMRSLFPPVSSMKSGYPYLAKAPFLLPVAWLQRIAKYRKETKRVGSDSAAEAMGIGNQRIELMRKYGILK